MVFDVDDCEMMKGGFRTPAIMGVRMQKLSRKIL